LKHFENNRILTLKSGIDSAEEDVGCGFSHERESIRKHYPALTAPILISHVEKATDYSASLILAPTPVCQRYFLRRSSYKGKCIGKASDEVS